jgi:hypothetical protein
VLFKAFTVYVRPVLEYCSSVWNPCYYGDINKIESVQRRFTKYLAGLKDCSYVSASKAAIFMQKFRSNN